MPFKDTSAMKQKLEFVRLATAAGANVSALCLRFGIGRTSAHKLIARYLAEGEEGLGGALAAAALEPAAQLCGDRGGSAFGAGGEPGLGRAQDRADPVQQAGFALSVALGSDWHLASQRHRARIAGRRGKALHPLRARSPQRSVADGLQGPCRHALRPAASAHRARRPLALLDRAVGLWRSDHPNRANAPDRSLPPLWSAMAHRHRQRPALGDGGRNNFTLLTVWLIEANVAVSHSRPCHPQTLGKEERFHRTLKAEALQGPPFIDLSKAQDAFDRGAMSTTQSSPTTLCRRRTARSLPARAPVSRNRRTVRLRHRDLVRRVQHQGFVSVLGHYIRLSKAFAGKSVAFRPTAQITSSTPGSDIRK